MRKPHCPWINLWILLVSILLTSQLVFPADFEIPPKPLSPHAHHPKIESALLVGSPISGFSTGSSSENVLKVITEIEHPLDESLLQALGAQVEARSRHFLRIRVPQTNLKLLAEQVPGISFIRRALSFVALGSRRTEGALPTGALLLQGAGWRGQNVKVAIIDLGFAQLSRAKQFGAIKPSAIVDEQDYTGENLETGTSHGVGVAEIVHAMAPQAWLYLKKVSDEVDLENAVEDAIVQGIQIINYSVGIANANFNDGTGIVAQLADRARTAGILWINAVGNHAQSHWQGSFSDRNGNRWIEFAPGREELLIKADFPGPIELYLTWDDWPSTDEDFDLFLYDSQGRLVASSQNYQTGYEQPTEEIQYVAWGPGMYRARVLARRVYRSNIRLKMFNLSQQPIDPNVPAGSILTPADARGALAVGAMGVHLWRNGPQEPFSSQGPTSDGRIKPDLIGPDGVSSYTLTYFSGTSAAAPHIAGAAALLLSQHPDWTADQLQQFLESQAIDLGELGKDNIYGAGKLNLALGIIKTRRTITPTRVRPGDLVTVTIEATMPPGLFGGFSLRDTFPTDWLLMPSQALPPGNNLAPIILESFDWVWPTVPPNETRTIVYQLHVPEMVPPGIYRWYGTVNSILIDGDHSVTVESIPDDGLMTFSSVWGAVHFRFSGSAERVRVRIYDLNGTQLFEDTTVGRILEWKPSRRANGAYLYVAEIVRDGRVIQTNLGKVVILR